MGQRKVIRRPRRVLCVGDLDTRVILHKRSLEEPGFGETDFKEDFKALQEVWAKVRTTSGKAFFSGAHVDVSVTHEISIRYRADVSSETWIELLDGRLLDVVDVENLEERNEWLVMPCTERGDKGLGSAVA